MTWIVLVPCAVLVAWFVARARLGARVRTLAGVRLGMVDRLASLFAPRVGRRLFVGGCAGIVAGGVAGGTLGLLGGLLAEPVSRARARRTRVRRLEEQLPDVLRTIATALRAGRSVHGAIEAARDETEDPARAALDHTVRTLELGASLDEALDAFASRAGSGIAVTVAETIRIGRRAGPNLPAILDVTVESLAERDRIARDRRAASAQARVSAIAVGTMPLAFYVLAGPVARAQLAASLSDPIGWMALTAGMILETAGIVWMRALAGSQ